MATNNLYRILPKEKSLKAIREVNFSELGFKERYDIQEWVEDTPEILGEDLLIVGKEFQSFEGTNERADLIAVDRHGNLVIIELKRDEAYASTEWQAMRYASYFSNFQPSHIVDMYVQYFNKYSKEEKIEYEHGEQLLLEFIDDDNISDINKNQRIILVAHTFAVEVTSTINWLISQHNMDVKCVQLIPFNDNDKGLQYIHSSVLLPLPGIENLIVKASINQPQKQSLGEGPVRKDDEVTAFFEKLKKKIIHEMDPALVPDKFSRWAGVGNGFRYYHFWYSEIPWENWSCSYKIWWFDEHQRKERKSKFGIYCELYRKYMLTKGVDESSFKKCIEFFEGFKQFGFEYKSHNESHFLEYYSENNELSEDNLMLLADQLKKIITATKPNITKIIGL